MSVAVDVAGTAVSGTSITTLSNTSLTLGAGSNRALVLIVAWRDDPGTITACQWDDGGTPQAMTLLASVTSGTTPRYLKIYGLPNPTSGNKTLKISWTNSREAWMNAVAFTGVDQTGGTTSFPGANTATGTSSGSSVGIAGGLPTDGAGVGVTAAGDASSITAVSETSLGTYGGSGAIEAGGSYSILSATFTGTYSGSDNWCCACVGVASAGSGWTPQTNAPEHIILVNPPTIWRN